MQLFYALGVCLLPPRILLRELDPRSTLEAVDLRTKTTASSYVRQEGL